MVLPAARATFFEHQFRTFLEIGLHPDNPTRRERILAKIEDLNKQAGQEVLRVERKGLRAGSLVGVLRVGDFSFEILPKLDWTPGQEATQANQPVVETKNTAVSNLIAMLSYAHDLRLIEQDTAGLDTQPDTWLEVLTRLFATGLQREIRAGLSQEYITREETLSALRGRWDLQRQLRRPSHYQTDFEVIYDDLSSDTPLNQILYYTIEQLIGISHDAGNQALLADLSAWFRPVTLLPQVPIEMPDGILFNRLNERFQPSFCLARMFLSGCILRLAVGDLPATAFVFDMNVLFERFVAGFISQYRRRILPAAWQKSTLVEQASGIPLYLGKRQAGNQSKNVLRLRPDLLLISQGQAAPLLVADTKYKRLEPKHKNTGILPDDVYQMLAYAVRLKCPAGLLLYPQTSASPVREEIEIDSAGLRLFIATINLRVPVNRPAGLVAELREIFHAFT